MRRGYVKIDAKQFMWRTAAMSPDEVGELVRRLCSDFDAERDSVLESLPFVVGVRGLAPLYRPKVALSVRKDVLAGGECGVQTMEEWLG